MCNFWGLQLSCLLSQGSVVICLLCSHFDFIECNWVNCNWGALTPIACQGSSIQPNWPSIRPCSDSLCLSIFTDSFGHVSVVANSLLKVATRKHLRCKGLDEWFSFCNGSNFAKFVGWMCHSLESQIKSELYVCVNGMEPIALPARWRRDGLIS